MLEHRLGFLVEKKRTGVATEVALGIMLGAHESKLAGERSTLCSNLDSYPKSETEGTSGPSIVQQKYKSKNYHVNM